MERTTPWTQATQCAAVEQRMSLATPIDYEVIEPSATVKRHVKLRRTLRDAYCFLLGFFCALTFCMGVWDWLVMLRNWLLSL
jgi:hypothetical protein